MVRSRLILLYTSSVLLLALAPTASRAQTPPPTPGPTNPNPPAPATPNSDNKTIVINPTIEQCRQGWSPGTQWTKEQFDRYCAQINVSK